MTDVWRTKHEKPLGARLPPEKPYATKYALSEIGAEVVAGRPVVIGVNWYSRFDNPVKDASGRWWAAKKGDNLGTKRGAHCLCVKPSNYTDPVTWWAFYDQLAEGACVGFGWSRCMSLFNRVKYDAPWLYHVAQGYDYWPGTNYEGTSVDAGAQVLKKKGHRIWTPSGDKPTSYVQGITAYRWSTSVDDIHTVIQMPLADRLDAVPLLNSWGRDGYPHITWLHDSHFQRLMNEDGEICVPTDR